MFFYLVIPPCFPDNIRGGGKMGCSEGVGAAEHSGGASLLECPAVHGHTESLGKGKNSEPRG